MEKHLKKSYNNNKLKISTAVWNDKFELPDGSYLIPDIQDYFEYTLKKHGENIDNPSIRICINKISTKSQSRRVYKTNSAIRFKTIMLKCSLCDYSDAYILVEGKITITGPGADDVAKRADERDKEIILKNCAPFINCKTEINRTEINNAKDTDIAMPIYI